jgi:hypothetical protein
MYIYMYICTQTHTVPADTLKSTSDPLYRVEGEGEGRREREEEEEKEEEQEDFLQNT